MNLTELQRGALVLYAAREAGEHASVEQMRAIVHILRNRVQGGWYENYLQAVEDAVHQAANEPRATALRLEDRRLQILCREIDDVLYGHADDEISRMCARQDKVHGPLLYWSFLDRAMRISFKETIVRKPEEHFQRGVLGMMYLYE